MDTYGTELGKMIGIIDVSFTTTHTKADGESSEVACKVDYSKMSNESIIELLAKKNTVDFAAGHAREINHDKFESLLNGKIVTPDWRAPAPAGSTRAKFIEKSVKAGYSVEKAAKAWEVLEG